MSFFFFFLRNTVIKKKKIKKYSDHTRVSLIVQLVKNPLAMQEILVQFLDREGLLEKG